MMIIQFDKNNRNKICNDGFYNVILIWRSHYENIINLSQVYFLARKIKMQRLY